MNSCDNLIEKARNTYLFKGSLKKVLLFVVEITKFSLTTSYLSADRDDGKIYLNVEYEFKNSEVEEYIKNWIYFNSEIIECFFYEVVEETDQMMKFVVKLR